MHNINKSNHNHVLEIVINNNGSCDSVIFTELDDTKKIFARFRALYYTLENEGRDYSIALINSNDNVRLCRASRSNNVIMYAYNKALLPINILATIPQ